jgi:hypothetical protein
VSAQDVSLLEIHLKLFFFTFDVAKNAYANGCIQIGASTLEAGVLDEPDSAKPAQQSSYTARQAT